jgi:glycine/sarcosine N-methyltransferase
VDDSYADLAEDYEWLFGDDVIGPSGAVGATSPGSAELLNPILDRLPPGAPVLDSACGIGVDALALVRRGFTVTACDASASMVAQARRRAQAAGLDIDARQSRWQDLPLRAPGPFDLILCLGNAIVHASAKPDMIASLQGLKAVLRPGGVLVIDSRNWEQLYAARPRVIPGRRLIERRGIRCTSLYIWTIPGAFPAPCRAEIVFLFADASAALTHRRYVIDFAPFRRADLLAALDAAGLTVIGDSYQPDHPFYAVAAALQ